MSNKKSAKSKYNREIINMDDPERDAKSFIEKVFGDISKTSATQQIIFGASSGWVTGYLFMKIGKVVAISLGSGIILFQIANEKGYIKVNWDKIERNLDKVSDKVEEKLGAQERTWLDKVEKFVDKKIDKVEDKFKKHQVKAKNWYSRFIGDEDYKLKKMHIFFISYLAGLAMGIGTS